MRFKKLRLILGICLVIFVLVVGNVIVLGILMKNPNKNNIQTADNIVNSKKADAVVEQNNSVVMQGSSSNSVNVDTTNNNTQAIVDNNPAPVDNTPVVVYHPTIRTSAS
jgi:hypothetical protein